MLTALELCPRKATCEQAVFMRSAWINPELKVLIGHIAVCGFYLILFCTSCTSQSWWCLLSSWNILYESVDMNWLLTLPPAKMFPIAHQWEHGRWSGMTGHDEHCESFAPTLRPHCLRRGIEAAFDVALPKMFVNLVLIPGINSLSKHAFKHAGTAFPHLFHVLF